MMTGPELSIRKTPELFFLNCACLLTSDWLRPRVSLGKVLPVTAYDKDGVRMLLNFASECPPGRPDVLVMVVSMLNTAPLPVHNVQLQAAVPKVELFICHFQICSFVSENFPRCSF